MTILLEQHLFGLEAGRVDVGDVVGHHVHLPLQGDLPAEADELRIFHGARSPLVPRSPRRFPKLAGPALTLQKPCQTAKVE
jgi:hypothetical protein